MNIVLLHLTGKKITIEITANDSLDDLFNKIASSLEMDTDFELEPNSNSANEEQNALNYFQELGLDSKLSYRVIALMCARKNPEDEKLLKGYYRIGLTKKHLKRVELENAQLSGTNRFFDGSNKDEFSGDIMEKQSIENEEQFKPL